jgi:hypothetical protein
MCFNAVNAHVRAARDFIGTYVQWARSAKIATGPTVGDLGPETISSRPFRINPATQ